MNVVSSRLVLHIAIGSIASMACECVEVPQNIARREAAVVFSGTVVRIEHLKIIDFIDRATGKPGKGPPDLDDDTIVTFDVAGLWKGPRISTVKVYSVSRPSMCTGYRFQQGREYVVYATRDINQDADEIRRYSNGVYIYSIGRPCPLRIRTDVGSELRLLGKSHAPQRGRD